MSKNSKNVVVTKKPCCKVCRDAGKPESEYTNHWVKDLSGKTICPTLLNNKCRYCLKLGHTAKFCDVLAKKNKQEKYVSQEKPIKKNVANKPKNAFASLCFDSDSEDEREPNDYKTCDFPTLGVSKTNFKPEQVTWAEIATSKVEPVVKHTPVPAVNKPAPWVSDKPVQTKKWSDYSDSEDEYESFHNDIIYPPYDDYDPAYDSCPDMF